MLNKFEQKAKILFGTKNKICKTKYNKEGYPQTKQDLKDSKKEV